MAAKAKKEAAAKGPRKNRKAQKARANPAARINRNRLVAQQEGISPIPGNPRPAQKPSQRVNKTRNPARTTSSKHSIRHVREKQSRRVTHRNASHHSNPRHRAIRRLIKSFPISRRSWQTQRVRWGGGCFISR